MTVPTEQSVVRYDGDGATSDFPTEFTFLENEHVVVSVIDEDDVETVLTQGVDYSIGGAGNELGGSVSITGDAPEVGEELVIKRVLPIVQLLDLAPVGTFSPPMHERQFDYLTEVCQQLSEQISQLEGEISIGTGFGGAPVNVTKAAAAAGVSTQAARADHKHDITTAAPSSVGTANSEGSASSLARSDHVHNHGTQALGSGNQHAVATESVAGFMAANDKKRVGGLVALSADPADETEAEMFSWEVPETGTVVPFGSTRTNYANVFDDPEKFVAPVAGFYLLTLRLSLWLSADLSSGPAPFASTSSSLVTVRLRLNSTVLASATSFLNLGATNGTGIDTVEVTHLVHLAADDEVDVVAFRLTGTDECRVYPGSHSTFSGALMRADPA
jgi:hypothetical protein